MPEYQDCSARGARSNSILRQLSLPWAIKTCPGPSKSTALQCRMTMLTCQRSMILRTPSQHFTFPMTSKYRCFRDVNSCHQNALIPCGRVPKKTLRHGFTHHASFKTQDTMTGESKVQKYRVCCAREARNTSSLPCLSLLRVTRIDHFILPYGNAHLSTDYHI